MNMRSPLVALGVVVALAVAAYCWRARLCNLAPATTSAAVAGLPDAARQGDLPKVQELIRAGTEVDTRDHEGLTALHLAAAAGHQDIVRFLIEGKADVNARGPTGLTPLLVAAYFENPLPSARILLEAGASPALASDDGTVPLHRAAATGNAALVRLLLSHSADPGTPAEDGATPLWYAISGGHDEVAGLLLDAGAVVSCEGVDSLVFDPLLTAIRSNRPALVAKLLAKGANVADARMGYTPLVVAAEQGNAEVVALLLAHGADVNGLASGGWALGEAAAEGHEEVVRILLESGAKLDLKSEGVPTALQQAVEEGHWTVAARLVRAGADVNVIDKQARRTPLHWAACVHEPEMVRLLLAHGANPRLVDFQKHTALEVAKAQRPTTRPDARAQTIAILEAIDAPNRNP